MKYMVMECHPAYAVLMDEDSRFVRAANLHYSVGQTVTDPVLMEAAAEETTKRHISMRTVLCIAAAAACLLLVSAVGLRMHFTGKKAQTESVVLLVNEKRYEMSLNSSGEVIEVVYSQDAENDGRSVTDDFNENPLSLASFLNSVLKDSMRQRESDEDTVHIYLGTENEQNYEGYKTEIEHEAARLRLKADVQELSAELPDTVAPEKPAAPEPPKPAEQDSAAAPPAPKENGHPKAEPPAPDTPPAPAHEVTPPADQPPAPQKPDAKPPVPDTVKPDDAPEPPKDDKPEPPEPPKPAEEDQALPEVTLPEPPVPESGLPHPLPEVHAQTETPVQPETPVLPAESVQPEHPALPDPPAAGLPETSAPD